MPKIIIGVATYMFEPYIGECLESLVKQTLPPGKIVVCDDCSTDDSWMIIKEYKQRFPDLFDIHRTENNIGVNLIGQFLVDRMTGGDIFGIIDGDDRWHPQKLEKEFLALEKHGAEIAYSEVNLINHEGEIIGEWRKRDDVPEAGDLFIPVYAKRIFKNCGSVFRNELITRKAFLAEGACDTNLTNYWDWDRKIRFARSFKIAFSGDKLVDYRKHPGGISKTFGIDNLFSAHIQVYEKHLTLLEKFSPAQQLRIIIPFETKRGIQKNNLKITKNEKYNIDEIRKRIIALLSKLNKVDKQTIYQDYAAELKILNLMDP